MRHEIMELDSLPRERGAFQAVVNEAIYQRRLKRRMQWGALGVGLVLLLLWVLPLSAYQVVAAGAGIVFVVSLVWAIRRVAGQRDQPAASQRSSGTV